MASAAFVARKLPQRAERIRHKGDLSIAVLAKLLKLILFTLRGGPQAGQAGHDKLYQQHAFFGAAAWDAAAAATGPGSGCPRQQPSSWAFWFTISAGAG